MAVIPAWEKMEDGQISFERLDRVADDGGALYGVPGSCGIVVRRDPDNPKCWLALYWRDHAGRGAWVTGRGRTRAAAVGAVQLAGAIRYGDTKGRLMWRKDETSGRYCQYYLKDPRGPRWDIVVGPWCGENTGPTLWRAMRRMTGAGHEDPSGFGGTRRRAVDNLLDIEEVVQAWR